MIETVTAAPVIYIGSSCVSLCTDLPHPRGSEVLVRISRCGVCHSDLHLQDGYFKLGDDKKLDATALHPLPFTLG